MNVSVSISYEPGDSRAMAKEPVAIAEEVLAALGGDPAKDSCFVSVNAAASLTPPPPPMETPPLEVTPVD